MPTKGPKKSAVARKQIGKSAAQTGSVTTRLAHTAAYETSLAEYSGALDMMRKGDWAKALERFLAVEAGNPGEPELADRARTYAALCARKLAPAPEAPKTAEESYYRGIVLSNQARFEEALSLFEAALRMEPDTPRFLYARATVRAARGEADAAVADLRKAIAGDPHLRFQAGNDTDFETIRDDAGFIDVIEPTPAGA